MDLAAHLHLDSLGIPYERREFPIDTEKGAANVARALGFEEAQMVKTLIFEAGDGERVLVMVGGDKSAISGHLKRAIGNRNIKMAPLEAVREVTGYEVGSVPPFHWQPPGFRSFIDHELMGYELLGVGAGVWGHEIILTPQDLARACKAIVVNLTDRERPVSIGAFGS
ncbi:MAG: YbaK/EbsC family protein [Acidobacteriota bacterium]|jgi:Cys-tRNA(Pro)/Cys-tRNA(Cys) deacylase